MPSIALSINVYQDASALRGLLENGSTWADNIYVIHSGPNGKLSTDGTIELCEEFGIRPVLADMNEGFGVIRTRLVHECGCDWAVIADADERIFQHLPIMNCSGDYRYRPGALDEPYDLKVTKLRDLVYPGQYLRSLIETPDVYAVRAIRRHWMDFSMSKPAENWEVHKDYQLRIVKNHPAIEYKRDRKMHEHLIDLRTGATPRFAMASEVGGPFFDHFHPFFRHAYPGKKEANEENYARLEKGEPLR